MLLAGLVVLAAPLWFFNNLIETALHRSEDSAMGLLREKLLQESERVKELMTPAAYIKETIKEAHKTILPEVNQNLIKLTPDKDFGQEIFNDQMPLKMLKALHDLALEPLYITVASPEFSDVHYWFGSELLRQCQEPENLASVMAYQLMSTSLSLYEQYYQNQWPLLSLSENLRKFGNFGFANSSWMGFTYLNRYSEFILPHDTVVEKFTDYYGRQSLYYYAYNCLSRVTLHGGYQIGILQESVSARAILRSALSRSPKEINVSLVQLPKARSGFFTNDNGLEFFDRPPTGFWNHFFFKQRLFKKKIPSNIDSYHIRLRASQPEEINAFRKIHKAFRLLAGGLLLLYAMAAIHYWLFGLSLQSSIRRKLVLLLAGIIFIPVAGSGLLAFISLKGSDRVIENHVMEKTMALLHEFILYDDENENRSQLAMLEIKRRIENYEGNKLDQVKILGSQAGDNLEWLRKLTGQHSMLAQDGSIIHFAPNLSNNGRDSHKLLDIILPKYFANLGLLKKRGNFLSDTFALGLSEDFISPSREESRLPHESTLQQEISHTLDTSRAATIIAQTRGGNFINVFSRAKDGDINTHAYLSEFAENSQKWFARSDPYCDIELSARLRRQYYVSMYAWPSSTLLNDEMLESFRWLLETKDSGRRIIHRDGGIKTNAWNLRPQRAAIFAAIGQNRGKGIGQFAISMIFPVLAGYAVLVVMVLSLLFAEFIIKPVKIFSEGIQRLSNEEYGVIIDKFSGDEFSQMTSAFNKMSAALRQREMIKRLVSARLVEQVESTDATTAARTEKVCISVVASDIRGFTSISEKFTPSEVVELLNTYFTAMEKAISENHGVIDKYIGDAIQAVFYEQPGLACSAERACHTALAMRRQLQELNQQRTEMGLFPLENGIGIVTGTAVSGSIGSETGRKDFTIIGRITERAAQLEAATVNAKSRILVCNSTQITVAGNFALTRHDDVSWELSDVG
jgi:class 3 adenylate cyclase